MVLLTFDSIPYPRRLPPPPAQVEQDPNWRHLVSLGNRLDQTCLMGVDMVEVLFSIVSEPDEEMKSPGLLSKNLHQKPVTYSSKTIFLYFVHGKIFFC